MTLKKYNIYFILFILLFPITRDKELNKN